MFEVGWTEMLVIAIVMIVVVGPKDLPKMLRTFGRTTSKLRTMAGDFRKQFDEALKEAELDDVKGLVDDVRKLNPTNEIKQALSPMQKAAADVRAGLDSALNPAKPETKPAKAEAPEPAGSARAAAVSPASSARPAAVEQSAPLKKGATGAITAAKPAKAARPARPKAAAVTAAKPARKAAAGKGKSS